MPYSRSFRGIHTAFIKALNIHLQNREEYVREASEKVSNIKTNRSQLKAAVRKAQAEFEEAAEKYNSEVSGSVSNALEDDHLAEYETAHKKAEENYFARKRAYLKKIAEISILTWYIEAIEDIDKEVEEYDPELFRKTIEKVVVKTNGKLAFYFVNGTKVTV